MQGKTIAQTQKVDPALRALSIPPARMCEVCGKPTNEVKYDEELGYHAEYHKDCDCRKTEPRYLDTSYAGITFDSDGNYNPQHTEYAKRYVEHWEYMHENGVGLILYGGDGSGKTWTAACIVNALLGKGVPVGMLTANKIATMPPERYNKFASGTTQGRIELLAIDDLGAERSTEYAKERVLRIIDERTKQSKPIIITTGCDPEILRNRKGYKRIFDRICARSIPLSFERRSIRMEQGKEILSKAVLLLTGQTTANS